MADMDRFVGYDFSGNPITEAYHFHGDSRYTARSEEAADMSNWNMMMYQNQWNTPEQQLSRLEEAGLNPLFYLGGNAGTTPAASGGNAQGHQMTSASGQVGQVLEASKNAADSLLQTQKQALDYDIQRRQQNLDLQRIEIEEGRLGNETRKTDQDIEESKSRIKFNEAQIDRLGKENEWTDQQIANAQVEIAKMNKEMDEIDVAMQEAGSRIDLNYANIGKIAHENKVLDAQVSELAARTGLERRQVETEIMKVYELAASAELKSAEVEVQKGQKVVLQKTAEGIEIKNELDKTYGGWERVQGIVSGYVHSAAEAVNTVVNVKTGGAKAALDKAMKTKTEADTEKSKAETEKTKAEKEYTEKKGDWLDKTGDQRSGDQVIRDAAAESQNLEWQKAREYRDEALKKAARSTSEVDRKYWEGQVDKYEKEMKNIEKGKQYKASKSTHFNPTFNIGD